MPRRRHGFTLVEVLVAIAIGMYICMLAAVLLVAVQRSVRSIDALTAQQSVVRVAAQRGALEGLMPVDFPTQQIALRTMMVAAPAVACYQYGVTLPSGPAYTFPATAECSFASCYGIVNPQRVVSVGNAQTVPAANPLNYDWNVYLGRTVVPLQLDRPFASYTGRPLLLMDPERQLVSVQTLGWIKLAGVWQTMTDRIYVVKDPPGATAPTNLLSQLSSGPVTNVFYGDRIHVLAPRL